MDALLKELKSLWIRFNKALRKGELSHLRYDEKDKTLHRIHTLKCLLDPNIQRNTHRSQNRIEAYHQLRSAIAQVYGKKQLIGKTNSALEISNQ